ncbi:hypothetical protein KI809_02135 [Geobacter pelophilus]|uniref:Uncharacterized protein n=1 Tax=Geoanaerobacter pelophilus TaxID=60036 RepID=A0AAW4L0P2_9BACT|nr:hypothetical protein [Geoanaerobacter pelophilus]MBT0663087.1 hypothetical protein [Geoanaerobacter pelophilus]
MRRCNLYAVLIMLFIVAANSSALALEEKMVNGVIVHENSNPKLITNFIEDVVSLLPPEMVQALEPHLETLNKAADVNVRDDYWRRKVIGLKDFKGRLEAISIKDGPELASQLGGSVNNIFEIALRPNNSDVTGDGLKKNLKEALTSWKNGNHVVSYNGYKGQSLDALLDNLYDLKKSSKKTLYPELVKTTADLWSAIWQRGGGKTEVVTKSFVRIPAELNFRKSSPAPSFRK